MKTSLPRSLASALLLVGFFATLAAAKGANSTVAATATFAASINSNLSGDTVFADLAGAYRHGSYVDTLGATVTGNSYVNSSSYFLRTVDYTGTTSTNIRGIYLDFRYVATAPAVTSITDPNDSSGAVLNLGGVGGTLNLILDLRIVASNLFSSTATTRGTNVIMPFSLQPEFTGSGDFELDYEANVAVTAPDANTRVLTAGPNAVATLYVIKGNKKTSVGRFYLPFTLTVTKGS